MKHSSARPIRKTRHLVQRKQHACIFVNPKARKHDRKHVNQLSQALNKAGWLYTLIEPQSASELLKSATAAASGKLAELTPDSPNSGTKVTCLIAVGGDGTCNLVARAAIEAHLPLGILPTGGCNNIARGLYRRLDLAHILASMLSGRHSVVDTATAGDQPFFGAIGIGFVPLLCQELAKEGVPKFSLGWSSLTKRVAAKAVNDKFNVRIDNIQVEARPSMLNVHLLPYAACVPFSGPSLPADGKFELIFDTALPAAEMARFVRSAMKQDLESVQSIRVYRARAVSLQPTKGKMLYLDGELMQIPTAAIEIKLSEKKLRVLG